ncbi:hypothetical protein HHI36_006483 [Cryptolaemus montrouzieri]|uniref:Uncharacterized protein n=1 Tax=Cryptolaemus montrouzieri TaxID=559131 RepID=A0ABD2NXF2_9CUCU
MITPLDDFIYLVNNVLLGEEPTVEDFILLIGTVVAFIAFVLWCCFPVVPKESSEIQYGSGGKTLRSKHYQRKEYTTYKLSSKYTHGLPVFPKYCNKQCSVAGFRSNRIFL